MSETDISTAAVERLLDGVTAGPWTWVQPYAGYYENKHGQADLGGVEPDICYFGDDTSYYPMEGRPPKPEDARFIAAARDLVPALLADRDRLAAEVARLREERDAAMAGSIRDITDADMKNIVAHLSYELEPQGPLPNRNSLMMEVVRLSNRLAIIQPAPAPQAREITVQEAAEVLLGSHTAQTMTAAGKALDLEKTLRALAAMQKGG